MKSFPLTKAYRFLEPGPVILLTTHDGIRDNVMTLSYMMIIDDNIPLIAVSMGGWDYSFDTLMTRKQCVVCVPADDMLKTVVDIGNCSGADTDKFALFGLTAVKASEVTPPLIAQCPVNLECVVHDDSLADKYNLIILRVVKAWADKTEFKKIHHNGDGTYVIDGETFDMKDRMTRWPDYIK
ncbi:MAG: flavin reductase family protein [Deferribacterales bacterium]